MAFPRPLFLIFAGGHDQGQLASRRNHDPERGSARAPADAGEVEQARSALEKNRVQFVFAHQPARILDAREAFLSGDGLDAIGHRAKVADRTPERWSLPVRRLRPGVRRRAATQKNSPIYPSWYGWQLLRRRRFQFLQIVEFRRQKGGEVLDSFSVTTTTSS